MARDQSGDATRSPEEAEAAERANRKHLGKDGCPQDDGLPREPLARDPLADKRPPAKVSEIEEPGLIDGMKGM